VRAVRHVNRLQNREKHEGHSPDLLRLMFLSLPLLPAILYTAIPQVGSMSVGHF